MLQPGIAFLEEALGIGRHRSVAILGVLTLIGCAFVVWFSKDVKALDTLDFWVGTFLIFVLATIQIVLFSWVLGIDKGWKEAHAGAAISIPSIFKPIMKYVCPLFLLAIFVMWFLMNVLGYSFETGTSDVSSYVTDLFGDKPNHVAQMSIGLVAIVAISSASSPHARAPIGCRWRKARAYDSGRLDHHADVSQCGDGAVALVHREGPAHPASRGKAARPAGYRARRAAVAGSFRR
jgi:hypothetical protein